MKPTLLKEENWIVSKDQTTGVASQGKTDEEALANLEEALELYYDEMSQEGLGVVDKLKIMQKYDNGGSGDYTAEKYLKEDVEMSKEEMIEKYL